MKNKLIFSIIDILYVTETNEAIKYAQKIRIEFIFNVLLIDLFFSLNNDFGHIGNWYIYIVNRISFNMTLMMEFHLNQFERRNFIGSFLSLS